MANKTDRERAESWKETAEQRARNEVFYRGLLEGVVAHLGPILVSDAGSVQGSPVRLKTPEMVAEMDQRDRPSRATDRPDWQQRVLAEKARHDDAKRLLGVERIALAKYMEASPVFKALPYEERDRMKLQLGLQRTLAEALGSLSEVLGERIAGF